MFLFSAGNRKCGIICVVIFGEYTMLKRDKLSESEKGKIVYSLSRDEILSGTRISHNEMINRSLEHTSFVRRCLMVNEDPVRDKKTGKIKVWPMEWESGYFFDGRNVEGLLPLCGFESEWDISWEGIEAKQFYIIDRQSGHAKDLVEEWETGLVCDQILKLPSVRDSSCVITNIGSLSPASFNMAFLHIERGGGTVVRILMHPNEFADVRVFGRDFYCEGTTREILTSKLFGHLWTADIHVSPAVPAGKIICVDMPDKMGDFMIDMKAEVWIKDGYKMGYKVCERIGVGLYDGHCSVIEVKR